MVKIKYRIIDDIPYISTLTAKEFDDEHGDLEGDFALYFGKYNYGHFEDEPIREGQWGWEILFHWFYGMLNVCIELKKTYYVLKISIETINYIEFKLKDDIVIVSILDTYEHENCTNMDAWGFTQTKQLNKFEYGNWKNVEITYDELKNEVVRVTESFFEEIETININLLDSKHILRMKSLVEKVKSIK